MGRPPRVWVEQALSCRFMVSIAVDERCCLRGQIVGLVIERTQRWKAGQQSDRDDLKDVFGARQIGQTVRTEIVKFRAGRQVVARQFRRDKREQYLPGVGSRQEGGCMTTGQAGVARRGMLHAVRVQGHADWQPALPPGLFGEQSTTGINGSMEGIRRCCEDCNNLIAHDFYDCTAMRFDSLPHKDVVAAKEFGHRLNGQPHLECYPRYRRRER